MSTVFKYTYESNINNIIHFLDVLIDSNDNAPFIRKLTKSKPYLLNGHNGSPHKHKISIINNLIKNINYPLILQDFIKKYKANIN